MNKVLQLKLSHTEDYYKDLSKAIIVDKNIIMYLKGIYDDPKATKNTKNFLTFYGYWVLPFYQGLGHIFNFNKYASVIHNMKEIPQIYEYFSRLSYDEFYDCLCLLPNYVVRKFIEAIDCDSLTFSKLIEEFNNKNKDIFVNELKEKQIDIDVISRICSFISEPIQLTELQNIYFTTTNEEEFHSSIQAIVDKIKSYKDHIDIEFSPSPEEIEEIFCFVNLFEEAEKLTKKTGSLAESLNILLKDGFDKYEKAFFNQVFDFWDDSDEFTQREKETLESILAYDQDIYNNIRREYELQRNMIVPLKLPKGLFKNDLANIYNKIGNYCPNNQDFVSIFGYNEDNKVNHIVWNGGWNELAYFLRVLYSGYLINGRIDCSSNMERGVWNKAINIFIDNKGSHPDLTTLKHMSIDKVNNKAIILIDNIFKEIFSNNKARKIE